jgi:hypothetical protein
MLRRDPHFTKVVPQTFQRSPRVEINFFSNRQGCFNGEELNLGLVRPEAVSRADFVSPRNPIVRFSTSMSYSQDPNDLLSHDVREIIRKDAKIDATVAADSHSIQLRMIRNPENSAIHFRIKPPSQTGVSRFVF